MAERAVNRPWAWAAGTVAALIAVTALTSIVWTAVLVGAAVLASFGWRRAGAGWKKWAAAAAAANLVLIPFGVALRGSAHREAIRLPSPAALVPMSAGAGVDAGVARASDPADWRAWMAAASVENVSSSDGPGVLDVERALLISQDPSALLAMSSSYAQRAYHGGDVHAMLADDEIAAYLTSLAGAPAPPDPRHS